MTGLIIAALLFVILFGIGFYLTTKLIYPNTLTHEETIQKETEAGRLNLSEWNRYTREEVSIESPYGYRIYGIFVPHPGSHKTVIIAHGISYTLIGSIRYLPLFYQRGFNVMLFDERYHGRSGGKNCTFGYYEKYDLKAVTDWVYQRMGGGGIVGVHGESLGAAIALQAAAIDERLAFIIADCAYSDLKKLLTYRLAFDFHLPAAIFLPVADFICTLMTGMSFDTVSPLRDVRTLGAPVLFIHGQDDHYIPPVMSQEMYHAKTNGIRELYLAPGARHAESFNNNRSEYNQMVGQFLARLGMDE